MYEPKAHPQLALWCDELSIHMSAGSSHAAPPSIQLPATEMSFIAHHKHFHKCFKDLHTEYLLSYLCSRFPIYANIKEAGIQHARHCLHCSVRTVPLQTDVPFGRNRHWLWSHMRKALTTLARCLDSHIQYQSAWLTSLLPASVQSEMHWVMAPVLGSMLSR